MRFCKFGKCAAEGKGLGNSAIDSNLIQPQDLQVSRAPLCILDGLQAAGHSWDSTLLNFSVHVVVKQHECCQTLCHNSKENFAFLF
uniref:Uncharacterized protein n=1 Tax=Anguilla anguilla TaxID=7936 RepID=A0A0E9XRG1_ANGAN